MSKPHKFDLKALIANEVAPAPEIEDLPAPELSAPDVKSLHNQVVALPRHVRKKPPAPDLPGTLKTRASRVSLYLEAPVYDQLREIAHVERTKLHPLMLEAIDLLLKKRGSPSIRELITRGA